MGIVQSNNGIVIAFEKCFIIKAAINLLSASVNYISSQ